MATIPKQRCTVKRVRQDLEAQSKDEKYDNNKVANATKHCEPHHQVSVDKVSKLADNKPIEISSR